MDNTINSIVNNTVKGPDLTKLTQQILASSDPRKWTGQGFGSAQANAADMAKILAQAGITDIKQLAQKQVYVPDMSGEGSYAPAHYENRYVNKDTGQELGNTYGERQQGNFFGGTYTGSGNTGYGVTFDAQGNPQFYTQGASSSDVNKDTLIPLALMGGLALGGGALGAEAAGGGSTIPALGGADLYADVAGAAGGTPLSQIAAGTTPLAAGGADLYADLANPLSGASTLGTAGAAGAGALGATTLGGTTPLATGGADLYADLAGANTGALGAGAGALGASTLGGAAGSTIGSGLNSYFTGGAGTGDLITGAGTGLSDVLTSLTDTLTGGGLGTALGVSSLGSLLSGILGAKASTTAADKQAAAAQYAADLQKQMFDKLNAQQAPYRAGGYNALNTIGSMMPGEYTKYDANGNPIGTATGNDYFTHQFNAQDFQNNIDPGYAWRLQQGQMANQRLANKAGGLLGANAQQGMQDYTQGLASQEYQNAFNRYTTNQSNIYNRLASLAGIGQTGQSQTNQAAQNAATNMGNLAVGAAGAQAAGGIGAANAYGNTLGSIGNNLMLSQLLNQKQNIG